MPPSISPTPSRTLLSTALAAFLACLVLLPLLGHRPLAEWDEAIYAEVSREMLSGGWLVPHWNQQPWLEKPPLTMWITAAFFKLFGVTEFWARACSALSGIAIVALLHRWLARRRDELTAWLSTLILLGTFGFLHACNVGETDVLLSLTCCVALIGLTQIDQLEPTGWYLFWIGFAAALMTKGAASIVLPLSVIAFAALQRWRAVRFGRHCWIGLALFLLLVLPWHLAMFHRFGNDFLAEYFGLHVLARATHQIQGHTTPWWYYFKVLLVSSPPFALLYPVALANAFRRGQQYVQLRIWAVFALVVVGFYTLVQTRLPQYIVPAYPALTVLTAVYLGERLRRLVAMQRPASFWIKLGLGATAVFTVTIWMTTPARKNLHSATLADGTVLPDNKDSTALLRQYFCQPSPYSRDITGPLLLWRKGRIMSIATDVFYSHRRIQQVQLQPVLPGTPTDRYIFDPEPLSDAVGSDPRLILLDRSLVPQIPPDFTYTPIQAHGTVELGSIVRR